MRSAITRNRNKIMKARREMDSLIREYSDYYGTEFEVKLTGAAALIADSFGPV